MLIGEVARRSGVSARMLRHYDSLGLVRPTGRTGAGYREYSVEDVRRILHIEALRSLGLSLREVGRALDDPGFTPAQLVDDLVRRTRQRIADETELLTRLRRVGSAEPAGWDDALRVVALLQALGSDSSGRRQQAALSTADAVPVEALVEAVLGEADPNVAGALRWALARAGDEGVALLAQGLDSPRAAVRERAVRALTEVPDGAATAVLHDALSHPDAVVRRTAALALGARGAAAAIPALVDTMVDTLVDMVVDGTNDADAADALGGLAGDPVPADRIAARLVGRLAGSGSAARLRLTQALADVPGPAAARALADLEGDGDRAVALTASSVRRRARGTSSPLDGGPIVGPVAGGITWRRVVAEDFAMLGRWLAEPAVARWWNHETSPEAVERDFGPTLRGEEPSEDLVASLDGRPFGLAQRCRIAAYPEEHEGFAALTDVPRGAVTIDYLIGEPGLAGHGLGTRMIRSLLADTWEAFPDAPCVIVAVAAGNVASWRALEKAGLVRVAQGHMEPDNPVDDGWHVVHRVDRPETCHRCTAVREGADPTWSCEQVPEDGGGTRWLCPACTRRHVRDIEAKLAPGWW